MFKNSSNGDRFIHDVFEVHFANDKEDSAKTFSNAMVAYAVRTDVEANESRLPLSTGNASERSAKRSHLNRPTEK